ncbi:MAG TPA: hypothetical protein VFJ14_13205 [Nocardioidaceae bacterium]|nr:hypothetical protein [Nocardioidaceae bacterium]
MTSTDRTDVHIERVALHGIALGADQRDQLRRALETELATRLDAEPLTTPIPPAPAHRENPEVGWSPEDDAGRLGRDLARAVHRRLGS